MSRTTLRAATISHAAVDLSVSASRHGPDLASFDRFVILVAYSGAFSMQAYLTPDECEELSSMLLLAAKEQRDIIATPTLQEAA